MSNKKAHPAFCKALKYSLALCCFGFLFASAEAHPGAVDTNTTFLKKLSLEELMAIEVTSVSRTSEKLAEVASAIQVITGEDIQRSGAFRLPEALRLAPNLQVAQINSHDWAVTARGFNGPPITGSSLTDKMLVMIDGRTVYTPLWAGVLWDAQNVMLEDIDRIECISGPGGSLWGANAMNGIINIISKEAKHSQGVYASAGAGSFIQDFVRARYGGHVGEKVYYRFYGQLFDVKSTKSPIPNDPDHFNNIQGGFRVDYEPGKKDLITLQGDLYRGLENESAPIRVRYNGQNILGRWTHNFSKDVDLKFQVYFDRTNRAQTGDFRQDLKQYDFDFQQSFAIAGWQKVLWGAGYRLMVDSTTPSISPTTGDTTLFIPLKKQLYLFTGFLQDQISIVKNQLNLTVGSKFLYNIYSRFEVQPSARIAYTPTSRHTLWAAFSRTVRTPSRLEAELSSPTFVPPGNTFKSEKVMAYELGYRIRPIDKIQISLSGFYNRYYSLRSIDAVTDTTFIFANHHRAKSWGTEFAINYWVFDIWRLRAGYTYFDKKITAWNPAVYPGVEAFEGIDPNHQAMLQSILDIPKGIQLDVVARFVSSLPQTIITPKVPAYFDMDIRVAWQYKSFTFAVVVQNAVNGFHSELGSRQIPRGFYGRITCRL